MEKIRDKTTGEFFVFLLSYIFSFGLIFFNKGLFADDWSLYGTPPQNLKSIYNMLGFIWPAYLHILVQSTPFPLLVYRSITFFSHFVAALCLNEVLKTVKEINSSSRVYLVLFFLLLPVNHARIEVVTTFYGVCYLFFFSGLWLTKKYFEKHALIWRILSLVAFFASMVTNSIILFYLIALVYIFYRAGENKAIPFLQKIKWLGKFSDYVVLPILFVIIKFTLLVPYGFYEGSNRIIPANFMMAFLKFIPAFYLSVVETVDQAFMMIIAVPTFIVLTTFVMFKLINPGSDSFHGHNQKFYHLCGIIGGILMLFLGIFPYLAVNHMPKLYTWESRDQLLVPLGGSFVIFFGMSYLFQQFGLKDKHRHFFFCILLALFMACNFQNYLVYQRHWYQQLSLMHHFSNMPLISDASTFLINDQTPYSCSYPCGLNDFRHILKLVFHDQKTRFAFDEKNFEAKVLDEPNIDYLTMQPVLPTKPQYRLVIKSGSYPLTMKQTIKLIVLERIRPGQFTDFIKRVAQVEYETL